ncbi:MAG: hypothetical protein KDI90_00930 [Alphaproteobacteria bacterium]|nr:hypothetical protein [Alphaproteobacteria bacterium]
MRYRVYILVLAAVMFPLSAYAEDVAAGFVKHCSAQPQRSASFCTCALKAFSDKLRKARKTELQKLERTVPENRKNLLADPAMSEGKVSAACDLHDRALEEERLASLAKFAGDQASYDQHTRKKLAFFADKKTLVESYGATHQTVGALVAGSFCDDRNKLEQIKKDFKQGENGLFPELLRNLENNPNYASVPISLTATRAGCS